MCGLAGLWDRAGAGCWALGETVGAMAATLTHRGPDGVGCWVDESAGLALGHRRLAVLDLSEAAAQPMVSASGRIVVVYNGEIYNFRDLRAELAGEGCPFRGHGDTEVLVAACERWGVAQAVGRCEGMFALAAWDRRDRTLTLARDPLGIKPVYWGEANGAFFFASELKALQAYDGWRPEVDPSALAAYLRYGYVPAPQSIYRGVWKLAPGCLLEVATGAGPRVRRYWSLEGVAEDGLRAPLGSDDGEAADALEGALREAVGRHLVADVPLGVFLSGGVDSSVVAALAQAEGEGPVRTFTVSFQDPAYDEARHAARVAAHLGTEHTELEVAPAQAREVIPALPDWYDEPFGDSSQVPTYLLSKLSRRHVTVALSGDGGDELFAGYHRHVWAERLHQATEAVPAPLRRAVGEALRSPSPGAWDRLFSVLPEHRRPRQAGEKVHKLAAAMAGAGGAAGVHERLVSQWEGVVSMAGETEEDRVPLWERGGLERIPDALHRTRLVDALTYLPDDVLTKVDRASMAVGLEVRVPLLDPQVVQLAWRLPRSMLVRGGRSKWLLRQVLHRHVPRALVERPKTGFTVPLDAWLRGPLREWAESLLAEDKLRDCLDPAPIRARWAEHLSGRRNWQHALWTVLMFQAWRARWLGG